jgi:hypothetical protein
MKRRSKRSGEQINKRCRKRPEPKPRHAPKAVADFNSASDTGETEIARLTRELSETREQQTATVDVLRIISSSPSDLQPVFNAILETPPVSAGPVSGRSLFLKTATFGNVARHNLPPGFAQSLPTKGFRPDPGSGLGEVARTKSSHPRCSHNEVLSRRQSSCFILCRTIGGTHTPHCADA